jgi:hypothetical protein
MCFVRRSYSQVNLQRKKTYRTRESALPRGTVSRRRGRRLTITPPLISTASTKSQRHVPTSALTRDDLGSKMFAGSCQVPGEAR